MGNAWWSMNTELEALPTTDLINQRTPSYVSLAMSELVVEQNEEEDDEFMNGLLDDMEEVQEANTEEDEEEDEQLPGYDEAENDNENIQKSEEEIKAEEEKQTAQRKYFQGLFDIFTDLDLTLIDENGDNEIELHELINYIQTENIAIPIYLAKNIFYTIDSNRNGFISPIEYLKWKRKCTVDDIARLTEVLLFLLINIFIIWWYIYYRCWWYTVKILYNPFLYKVLI